MLGLADGGVGEAGQRDDEHAEALGFESDVDGDGVAAAGGDGPEAVLRAGDEVAPEDGAESLDVFEEHGLALAVGTDDRVVKGHGEFDDGMEPWERSIAREDFFYGHARVAGAEDMDESIGGDAACEAIGGLLDAGPLIVFDGVERGTGGGEILRGADVAHEVDSGESGVIVWPSLTHQPPSTWRTVPVTKREAGSQR